MGWWYGQWGKVCGCSDSKSGDEGSMSGAARRWWRCWLIGEVRRGIVTRNDYSDQKRSTNV